MARKAPYRRKRLELQVVSRPPAGAAGTTSSQPSAGGSGSGLAPPSGLWFTGVTDTTISLSWTEASGAIGYKVYRSPSASGAFIQAGSTGGFSRTSYTDTGLASGTIYYYKVSCIDAGGESDMSAFVGNKTSDPEAAQGSVPPAPAGLGITGITSDSIEFSWNAVSGASGYKIYRADSASGEFAEAGTTSGSNQTSYTDLGLAPNSTYYYKVSAINSAGESEKTAAVYGCTGGGGAPPEGEELIITQLDLSGIVATPEESKTPQTAPNALSHSQYSITALTWQTDSGGTVSGVFAEGTVYKAVLVLWAQGAYTFAGLGADAFTCNGADSVTAAITGQTATVTITFPVTRTKIVLENAGTASDFLNRLDWLKDNAESDKTYVITITNSMSIEPQTLNANTNPAMRNTTVKIVGTTGKIIKNSSSGALFTIEGYNTTNKFTLILDGNIKLEGSGTGSTGVKVNKYADFIMEGGTIYDNGNSGVSVAGDGTFTMSGGTISGNTVPGSGGGGVYVNNSGTFTMSGGTISGNTVSSGSGGGVYVSNGTFTMLGGTISGNTSSSSGGVYVSSGTFTMSGGTISGNTASSSVSSGSGVYVSSGTFTMSGGTISGNTFSSSGGSVLVNNRGSFTMTGGTISENSGRGVLVDYSGSFTMSGGIISGNTTSGNGGGVFVSRTFNEDRWGYETGTFIKSGNSIIYGNDAYDTSLKNTATGNSYGHAVYINSSKKRNSTAYAADTMDSRLSGSAGGWE